MALTTQLECNQANPSQWLPKRLWGQLRLAQKLAIGVWLSIIPFSVVGTGFALWNAQQMALREWEGDALKQVNIIDAFARSWNLAILNFLKLKSEDIEMIDLSPAETIKELGESKRNWPDYNFTVVSPSNAVIASTSPKEFAGISTNASPVFTEKWLQVAMRGKAVSFLAPSRKLNTPYFVSLSPILRQQKNKQDRIIGVLASQIKVSNFDKFTGIDLLFSPNPNSRNSYDALINLDGGAGERRGVAAMIIVKPGIIHFVGHGNLTEKYRNIMLDAANAKHSRWLPVIEEAMKRGRGEEIKSISIDGTKFLLAIKKSSPSRSTVLISDQNTVFKNINTLFFYVWLINVIALILSSLAIYRICSALSKPVDQAGEALAAISAGNFDVRLPIESSDLGRLFNYINQASDQLRAYLSASIKQAVIDAQLKEARLIQESFLIKDLPSLPQISLIASSSPAYEIGADWYDAIAFGDSVYIVVADVCDKGIPSALYMSVFRSLLRNNIEIECKNSDSHGEVIVKAMSALNDYMAINHGDTAMFATIFVGAYATGDQALTYVVAGHEAPFLLCDQRLEALEMGGAAVGLFRDAVYKSHQCRMTTGSLLLAYSDGLPDSRNIEGFSFGTEGIRTILEERSSYQWKAIELMQRLQQAEAEHRGEAEQFDDLTLLVMKVEQAE